MTARSHGYDKICKLQTRYSTIRAMVCFIGKLNHPWWACIAFPLTGFACRSAHVKFAHSKPEGGAYATQEGNTSTFICKLHSPSKH